MRNNEKHHQKHKNKKRQKALFKTNFERKMRKNWWDSQMKKIR
jgi:uncharacterized membrane protein YkvA (DUF1232 family)